MKCVWIQSTWEAHVFQHVCGTWFLNDAFNVPVDVSRLHIGVRLRVLFLLRFHKALCLLQFYFSCVSANFSFKGIIEDPLTVFNFSVSICDSNLVCIALFVLLSVTLFVKYFFIRKFKYFFIRKFLPFSEDTIVIHRWGLVMMLQAVCGMFPGLGTSH